MIPLTTLTRRLLIVALLLCIPALSNSQLLAQSKGNWVLKGVVKDSKTEPIIGATIYNNTTKSGITSGLTSSAIFL